MKKLLVILLVLIPGISLLPQLNPCVKITVPNQPALGIYNRDSIMIDTCSGNYEKYARKWYRIEFYNDPFKIDGYKADTLIKRTWRDLDTNYTALREMFDSVEKKFGPFYFVKTFPHITDSSSIADKSYEVAFDNFNICDSIIDFIKSFHLTNDVYLISSIFQTLSSNYMYNRLLQEPILFPGPKIYLKPDENNSIVNQYFVNKISNHHELSQQPHLFQMKCPMAWEITTGNSDVIIDIHDDWMPVSASWGLYGKLQQPTASIFDPINNSNLPKATYITNSGNYVWICGENGFFAFSTNGGSNFKDQVFKLSRQNFIPDEPYDTIFNFTSIAMKEGQNFDNTTGYLIGKCDGMTISELEWFDNTYHHITYRFILRTTNGGKSWTRISLPNKSRNNEIYFYKGDLKKVFALNNDVWVIGDYDASFIPNRNVVFHSSDNGETWTISELVTDKNFVDIAVIENGIGWLLGNKDGASASIWKLNNGSWSGCSYYYGGSGTITLNSIILNKINNTKIGCIVGKKDENGQTSSFANKLINDNWVNFPMISGYSDPFISVCFDNIKGNRFWILADDKLYCSIEDNTKIEVYKSLNIESGSYHGFKNISFNGGNGYILTIPEYDYLLKYLDKDDEELGFGIGKGLKQVEDQTKDYTGDFYLRINNAIYPYLNTYKGNIILQINDASGGAEMGDGNIPLVFPYPSHGLGVMSTAISRLNGKGNVGVCPSCNAVGTSNKSQPYAFLDQAGNWNIDIDGIKDGIHKIPDIFSMSVIPVSTSDDPTDNFENMIDKGMIIVTHPHTIKSDFVSKKPFGIEGIFNKRFDQYLGNFDDKTGRWYKREPPFDHMEIISDNKDFVPIVNWDYRISLGYPQKKGYGTFSSYYNESNLCDLTYDDDNSPPFNTDGSRNKRQKLDLVLPVENLGIDGYRNIALLGGSSYAIPKLSGIIGLMLSIEKNLNVAPEQRHEKAYNILTLTANKTIIKFNGITPDQSYIKPPDGNVGITLNRYWSKRAGFGMVNAYRAVAHSISLKGDYHPAAETTGVIIFPAVIPEGATVNTNEFDESTTVLIKLMHWGAYKDNSDKVLEYGGNKIPLNPWPDYDNSWGKTVLNNSLYKLPANSYLVIDGILTSTVGNAIVSSTEYDKNKILMQGYLEGVTLKGTLKIDDLIVQCTTTTKTSKLQFEKDGAQDDGSSVIYGKVRLLGSGEINVGNNDINPNLANLLLMTGGSISLEGENNLLIKNGATLTMVYGSEIRANNGQKVIIEPGGKLVIEEGAMVHIDCEVEIQGTAELHGVMEVNENTLVYCDKIKLNEFGTLTLKEDARIQPEDGKTGKVIIMPAAVLTIINPNPLPVVLLGGVDVLGERITYPNPITNIGKLIVTSDSKLYLGPFSSTSYTLIEFQSGAEITLFASKIQNEMVKCQGIGSIENVVKGDLKIGSLSGSITKVSSFNGEYQFEPDYYGIAGFVYSTIKLIGSISMFPVEDPIPYFNIQRSQTSNVSFKLINTCKSTVFSSTFSVDSKKMKGINEDSYYSNYKKYFSLHYPITILETANDIPAFQMIQVDSRYTLDVNNCFFKDVNDVRAYVEDPKTDPPNKYHFKAISVINHSNVNIFGDNDDGTNEFDNIKMGIETNHCRKVEIMGNKFDICDVGINDNFSNVRICSNDFNLVRTGASLVGSYKWKTYNNTFSICKYSFETNYDACHILRSNYFQEYLHAIHNPYGQVFISGFDPFINISLYKRWGRNIFQTMNPSSFNNGESSPFYTISGTPKTYPVDMSDVFLYDLKSKVILSCGLNNFSNWSTNHLYSEMSQSNILFCNYNQFNNSYPGHPEFYFRKNDKILDNPLVINTSEVMNYDCNTDLSVPFCEWSTPDCDYFVRNDGDLPEYPSDAQFLDDMFWAAYNDFCLGVLNCDCMKVRLRDALQAATLGDSSFYKLQLLRACLLVKINDPTPECRLNDFRLRLGDINEKINDLTSALTNFNDVLNNFPNKLDTMYAKWRIDYLTAQISDTTHSILYDSLMSIYSSRLITDITRWDTIHNPNPKIGTFNENSLNISSDEIESLAIQLEQNQPNPFTSLTEIQYFINVQERVNLALYNLEGKMIANLVDKYVKPGWHTLIINGSGLNNGCYLLRMTAGDKMLIKKLMRNE